MVPQLFLDIRLTLPNHVLLLLLYLASVHHIVQSVLDVELASSPLPIAGGGPSFIFYEPNFVRVEGLPQCLLILDAQLLLEFVEAFVAQRWILY